MFRILSHVLEVVLLPFNLVYGVLSAIVNMIYLSTVNKSEDTLFFGFIATIILELFKYFTLVTEATLITVLFVCVMGSTSTIAFYVAFIAAVLCTFHTIAIGSRRIQKFILNMVYPEACAA